MNTVILSFLFPFSLFLFSNYNRTTAQQLNSALPIRSGRANMDGRRIRMRSCKHSRR